MGIPSKEENDLKPFGLAKWLSPRGIVPSGSALVPWGEKKPKPSLVHDSGVAGKYCMQLLNGIIMQSALSESHGSFPGVGHSFNTEILYLDDFLCYCGILKIM